MTVSPFLRRYSPRRDWRNFIDLQKELMCYAMQAPLVTVLMQTLSDQGAVQDSSIARNQYHWEYADPLAPNGSLTPLLNRTNICRSQFWCKLGRNNRALDSQPDQRNQPVDSTSALRRNRWDYRQTR